MPFKIGFEFGWFCFEFGQLVREKPIRFIKPYRFNVILAVSEDTRHGISLRNNFIVS